MLLMMITSMFSMVVVIHEIIHEYSRVFTSIHEHSRAFTSMSRRGTGRLVRTGSWNPRLELCLMLLLQSRYKARTASVLY